jgi:hypothetical protein
VDAEGGDNGAVGALTLRDIELATLMWAMKAHLPAAGSQEEGRGR